MTMIQFKLNEVLNYIPDQYKVRMTYPNIIVIQEKPYIAIRTDGISDIQENDNTVTINTAGAVISFWKQKEHIHITIL